MWELPFFLLMGVVGGLLGSVFNALNIRLCKWRKLHRRTAKLMVIEAVLVAFLTATCQFWLPAIYSQVLLFTHYSLTLARSATISLPIQCALGTKTIVFMSDTRAQTDSTIRWPQQSSPVQR